MAKSTTKLSLFGITMINIIAVDSLRTLSISAQYGLSLLFYYLLAGLFFFIPSALVAAELGTGWPKQGGLYIWVKEAFGPTVASVTIWLNWVYNLAWYPTIMALITGVFAYIFMPSLAKNPYYMTLSTLTLFWLATYVNIYGMRLSAWVSTLGALIGTLLPMLFIIVLGAIYLFGENPSYIKKDFFPSEDSLNKLGFFSSILFGLLGLEMAATHAKEMADPTRDYPKSLLVSSVIILGSIVLASLSIALVVPHHKLNLVVGVIQAFKAFFETFNMPWMTPIIGFCIVLGALSSVSAWIIGPTKGIMVAAKDHLLPTYLTKENSHGVPVNALITQGVIVSILICLYLFMPSVGSTFILLSIVTAQLALIVYAVLFASCIVLHYKKGEVARPFKIPWGNKGIWLVSGSGIAISFIAFIAGFIPPQRVLISNIFLYESLLVGVMLLLTFFPLLLAKILPK